MRAPACLAADAPQDWAITLGNGSATTNPPGFVTQDAKNPLVVELKDPGADDYLLSGEVLLGEAPASLRLAIWPQNPKPDQGPAPEVRVQLGQSGKLMWNKQTLHEEKIDVATTWYHFSAQVVQGNIEFHLRFPEAKVIRAEVPPGRQGVSLMLRRCQVRGIELRRIASLPKHLLPVVLDRAANAHVCGPEARLGTTPTLDPQDVPAGVKTIDNIPFCFAQSPAGQAIDVSLAKRDKRVRSKKVSKYDFGGFVADVPGDQYSAIHLIAFSVQRAQTAPRMAVRLGFEEHGADLWTEKVVTVPYLDDAAPAGVVSSMAVKLSDGRTGHAYHLRVPLAGTGNLTEFATLSLAFVRDIHVPDGGFSEEAVDPPSSVVVLAATLERSPVRMKYTTAEHGNIFYETQKCVFRVQLQNTSERPQAGCVQAACAGPGTVEEQNPARRAWTVEQPFELAAGQTKEIPLDVTPARRGWYSCRMALCCAGAEVQSRDTSFAVLASDTRKALDDSPFGIWCFWNAHAVTKDPQRFEKLASLFLKGGWRWTQSQPPEAGGKQADPAIFQKMKDRYKLACNMMGPPHHYARSKPGAPKGQFFDAEEFRNDVIPWLEKARACGFDPRVQGASRIAELRSPAAALQRVLRRHALRHAGRGTSQARAPVQRHDRLLPGDQAGRPAPGILLINDYPAFAGEYLKRKFPAELFDVIGLESAMFHRQPERQPDWLCLLGTLHQIKRIQTAYGYHKPIWFTEALYHSTKPGTLDIHRAGDHRGARGDARLGQRRRAAGGHECHCRLHRRLRPERLGHGRDVLPRPGVQPQAQLRHVRLDDPGARPGQVRRKAAPREHLAARARFPKARRDQRLSALGRPRPAEGDANHRGRHAGCVRRLWKSACNRERSPGHVTVEVADAPMYVTGVRITAVADRQPVDEGPSREGQLVMRPARRKTASPAGLDGAAVGANRHSHEHQGPVRAVAGQGRRHGRHAGRIARRRRSAETGPALCGAPVHGTGHAPRPETLCGGPAHQGQWRLGPGDVGTG